MSKLISMQIHEVAEKLFVQNVTVYDIKRNMDEGQNPEKVIDDLTGLTKACMFAAAIFVGVANAGKDEVELLAKKLDDETKKNKG